MRTGLPRTRVKAIKAQAVFNNEPSNYEAIDFSTPKLFRGRKEAQDLFNQTTLRSILDASGEWIGKQKHESSTS